MPPKKIAWGFVTRDIGNGKELLVAERFKKDDPLREGQLVIPGGGFNEEELADLAYGLIACAKREVSEETGIPTDFTDEDARILNDRICSASKIEWYTQQIEGMFDGTFHLHYKDSGKNYAGTLVPLTPINARRNPSPDHVSKDSRKPRYMSLTDVLKNPQAFTPACRILLYFAEDNLL